MNSLILILFLLFTISVITTVIYLKKRSNKCLSNQIYKDRTCINCPVDTTSKNNKCVCKDDSKYLKGDACLDCPYGQKYDPEQDKCVDRCLTTQYYNNKVSDPYCVDCSYGKISDSSKKFCVNICTENQIWDIKQQKCIDCPYFKKSDQDNKTCILKCSEFNRIFDTSVNGCVCCPAGNLIDKENNECIVPPKIINTLSKYIY